MSAAAPAASDSERVLIVAPMGRDAMIAGAILAEARLPLLLCADLACLLAALDEVGVALVAEESLLTADYPGLVRWI